MTAQYSCHFTGTALAPCGDLAIAVRRPYDYYKSLRPSCDVFFCSKITAKTLRSPHVRRAATVRGSCDAPTTCLRTTGLRFLFFVSFRVKKIELAAATLRRPKTVRYRTASVRRPHENENYSIVRSP